MDTFLSNECNNLCLDGTGRMASFEILDAIKSSENVARTNGKRNNECLFVCWIANFWEHVQMETT